MMQRLFIAIQIPEEIKTAIGGIIDVLKKSGTDVRWVKQENIHVTLQFLGETDEALIPEISEALKKRLSSYPPFYITIAHVGCFPDKRRPRVIWVGIEESASLINLYKDITDEMSRFGYQKEERNFTAHLTIGRIKSNKNIHALFERFDEISTTNFSDFSVQHVTLMKSELNSSGAKYCSLAEIPLSGRSNVN